MAWSGTCYVTPLLGGWLADSFAGRWLTIISFMGVYIFGMVRLRVLPSFSFRSLNLAAPS